MPLRFDPPSFVRPREYENIPESFDAIFGTYQRNKQLERQERLQNIQLAQQGIDPTMATDNPHDLYGPLIERHKQESSLKSQTEQAKIRELQSQAAMQEAHANYFDRPALGANGAFNPNDAAKAILEGRLAPSQLPGFGQNSLRAQALSKLMQMDPNFDLQNAELNYTAKQGFTRFKNSSAIQAPLAYLESVGPNLIELDKLSDKIERTGIKSINRAVLAAKEQYDPDVAAFKAVATEVGDQIAKILQGGGTGSATSDAKLKQGVELLDRNYSPVQLKRVISELRPLLENRGQALRGGAPILPRKKLLRTTPPVSTGAVGLQASDQAGSAADRARAILQQRRSGRP